MGEVKFSIAAAQSRGSRAISTGPGWTVKKALFYPFSQGSGRLHYADWDDMTVQFVKRRAPGRPLEGDDYRDHERRSDCPPDCTSGGLSFQTREHWQLLPCTMMSRRIT